MVSSQIRLGWRVGAVLVLAGALALPGCGRRLRRGVLRAATTQMNCPMQQLTQAQAGRGMFTVSGCGLTAVYRCSRRGRCVLQSGPTPIGGGGQVYAQPGYAPQPQPGYAQVQAAPPPQPVQAAPPAPTGQAWTGELGQAIFTQISPAVLVCVPPPTRISLTLEFQPNGQVSSIGGMEAFTPDQQACLTVAVQAGAIAGGLREAVRVPFNFRL